MLNNYVYVFNTAWEMNLTHWIDWGRLRHVVDDAVRSDLGAQLVETMQYSATEQPAGYNLTQCFGLALLGAAHTHGAELVYRRASPSRKKRAFWRDYSAMFARKFCPDCDFGRATRPLVGACPRRRLNIVLVKRTHDPASSRVMFANGRGRRILNNDALAAALGAFGRVRNVDPGRMTFGDQIKLMMSADILVGRMSSQVAMAMFLAPGAICVEVEAPDPARLYYDHASTFEELAEIYDHAYSRTTHRRDDQAGVLPQAIVGNARKCKRACSGPAEFRVFQGEAVIARCERRCDAAAGRLDDLRAQPDAYLRDEWYRNWWLADTHADVAAVVEQITVHLGCDA